MVTIDEYGEPLERAIATMREQMGKPEYVAKPSWRGVSVGSLFSSIAHNDQRLMEAAAAGDRDEAWRRAANIANHAWMIADNTGRED
jgi:hypothetical protein